MKKQVSKNTIIAILIALIVSSAIYTLIMYGTISKETKVNIIKKKIKVREPIFVPKFIDKEKIKYKTRFNFTYDSPDVLRNFRNTEKLDLVIKECKGDFEVAKTLMSWTREQWKPGRPDPYPPINARVILKEIRNGKTGGFCAQYNYVFVQALQSFGIKARYVTIKSHEVTEVWIIKLNKWVCFDPLYNTIYLNKNNVPLNVLEIYKNRKNNKFVKFSEGHLIKNNIKQISKFIYFSVWIKNDHIESPINFNDIEHYKVYFIDDTDIKIIIPQNALFTIYKKDLYFDPHK